MKQIMLLLTILGFSVGAPAWAASLTVPNTFVGGQKALASEVNANFDEVEAEVTDNAANISRNAADISSNADSITQNAADINSNAASISDLKANKLDTLTCSDGQVLKYNAGTGEYECAEDLDTTQAHSHNASDIMGTIDADSIGGMSSTFVHDLWAATCMLYGKIGQQPPANIDCQTFYKKVFVTSAVYNGALGGLDGADSICQTAANNASHVGIFKAWISDSTTSVDDRFSMADFGYMFVDGTVWPLGTIPLNRDEYGTGVDVDTLVWTNTNPDGSFFLSYGNCSDWSTDVNSIMGVVGDASQSGFHWSRYQDVSCDTAARLYCFEQ